MYGTGQGVPQDYAQAAAWYRKAADQGIAQAQSSLGRMYANGQGVPQDDVEAVKWTRLAADHGRAVAQLNLGLAYFTWQGVQQDYVEAHKWVTLAASRVRVETHVSHLSVAAELPAGGNDCPLTGAGWWASGAFRLDRPAPRA